MPLMGSANDYDQILIFVNSAYYFVDNLLIYRKNSTFALRKARFCRELLLLREGNSLPNLLKDKFYRELLFH